MTPTELNLSPLLISCGATWTARMTIGLNLTGYGVELAIINSARSATPAITLTIGSGATLVSATSSPSPESVVDLAIFPVTTATFAGVDQVEYRLTLIEPGGAVKPFLFGSIPVQPWRAV